MARRKSTSPKKAPPKSAAGTASTRSSGRGSAKSSGRRPATLRARTPARRSFDWAFWRRLRVPGTPAQRAWAGGFLLLIVAGLLFLGQLAGHREHLAAGLIARLHVALGWGAYAVPLALAAVGGWLIALGLGYRIRVPWLRLVGVGILLAIALGLTQRFGGLPTTQVGLARGGGAAGHWLDTTLSAALGGAGAAIVLIAVGLVALSLALEITLSEVLGAVALLARGWREAWARIRVERATPAPATLPLPLTAPSPAPARPADEPVAGSAEEPAPAPPRPRPQAPLAEEAPAVAPPPAKGKQAKTAPPAPEPPAEPEDLPAWQVEPGPWDVPRVEDVLKAYRDGHVNVSELRARSRLIEHTLVSLGVPVSVVEVNPGPAVTQFGLEPGYTERKDRQGRTTRSKVKVSRIQGLSNDLALALAASPIRIEAPVPGKSVVGVEVPNSEAALVGLRGVLESPEYRAMRSPLAVVGRDVSTSGGGRPRIAAPPADRRIHRGGQERLRERVDRLAPVPQLARGPAPPDGGSQAGGALRL